MPAPPDRSAARRLILWFAVATVLPTLALVWLGWAVVQQGRGEERTRAAERAAVALQRVLTELGDTLDRAATLEPGTLETPVDAAVIVTDGTGLLARSGIRLPFYPDAPKAPDVGTEFARASELEFRDDDLRAAAVELTGLAASPSIHVRAEALLRLARVLSKNGESDRGLATLDELEALDDALAGGLPAGLTARRRRVVMLRDLGRTGEASREAAALASDLVSGRWVVTYPQYEATRGFVAEVTAGDLLAEPDLETAALAEAAGQSWQTSQAGARAASDEEKTETIRVGEVSVLALAAHERCVRPALHDPRRPRDRSSGCGRRPREAIAEGHSTTRSAMPAAIPCWVAWMRPLMRRWPWRRRPPGCPGSCMRWTAPASASSRSRGAHG